MTVKRKRKRRRFSFVNSSRHIFLRGVRRFSRRWIRYKIVFSKCSSNETRHGLSSTFERIDSNSWCRNQTTSIDRLVSLVDFSTRKIFVQVSSNAPILFRQASSIGTIEDVLENMQTRIVSLKSTVDRISSKVTEPYNKILVRKYQLTRLQVRKFLHFNDV